MAFQGFLKEDTATTIKLGPFTDITDGVTYEVGMAAAMNHADTGVRISKNGGAFAARTTATEPVYDAFGYYLVNLDATDAGTSGRLKVIFGAPATCLPCEADFEIVNPNIFDSLFAATTTDYLQVDTIQLGGATQSATDLKDFADLGYDPTTHKVAEVVLTDTLTTYTGNTPQTGDPFARIGALGAGLTAIPTYGDFTTAQKTSLNAATPASIPGTVGSVTGNVGGNIVGSVASVTADVGITQAGADKVWGTTVRALTDKVGFVLSSAGVQAIWDALTSALVTAGSIGKKLADWVVGTIDTYTGNTKQTGDGFVRLGAPVGASISADVAAVKAQTVAIETDTARLFDTAATGDADSPTADSVAEVLRQVRWFVANKWDVNEVPSPDTLTIYKDDGITTGITFQVYTSASHNYRIPV